MVTVVIRHLGFDIKIPKTARVRDLQILAASTYKKQRGKDARIDEMMVSQ